jgi:16S rRNA (guanine1207-N2)-methyltransferase
VAAFSGEAHVVMAEVNERAADLARRNADRNRVTNIEILPGDAFATLGARRFDAILTNPPIHAGKATVLRLIEDAHQRLTAGGALWMVIRTHAGAKSYFTALQARFGDARHLDTRGGYRVFRAGLTKGPGRL